MLLLVALLALFNFGKKSCVYIVKRRSLYNKYNFGCLPCLSVFLYETLIRGVMFLLVIPLTVILNGVMWYNESMLFGLNLPDNAKTLL